MNLDYGLGTMTTTTYYFYLPHVMPRAEDDDAKVHAKYSDLKAETWSQNLMAFILIFLIYLIFYP